MTFKNIITLSIFIYKVFFDLSSTALEELGFLVVSAGKAFLVEYLEALNYKEMKDKLGDLLSFLWAVCKNRIV